MCARNEATDTVCADLLLVSSLAEVLDETQPRVEKLPLIVLGDMNRLLMGWSHCNAQKTSGGIQNSHLMYHECGVYP